MEPKLRWAGCTREGNPLPFVTAMVASNPGDFGQGRVRCLPHRRVPLAIRSKIVLMLEAQQA